MSCGSVGPILCGFSGGVELFRTIAAPSVSCAWFSMRASGSSSSVFGVAITPLRIAPSICWPLLIRRRFSISCCADERGIAGEPSRFLSRCYVIFLVSIYRDVAEVERDLALGKWCLLGPIDLCRSVLIFSELIYGVGEALYRGAFNGMCCV